MPGKLTLHPPQRASREVLIREGESVTIGRDPGCSVVLDDPRVSKRHARLQWREDGWGMEDLDSKNGTSVNGVATAGRPLADGDWISLGGLMGRFERVSNEQAERIRSDRAARLATTLQMRSRLTAELAPAELVLRFLESAMEVTGTERGFVMVAGPDGTLRAEAAAGSFGTSGVNPDFPSRSRSLRDRGAYDFAGSAGALRLALETNASVVVSDAQSDAYLGQRPSVVEGGIGVLACVPLRLDGRVLGLIYVDSRRTGTRLTDLDLEILEGLAEHTAIALAGMQVGRKVRDLFRATAAAGSGTDPGLLEALQRRIEELAGPGPLTASGSAL